MIHFEDPLRFGASCIVAGMIAGDLFAIISGRAVGRSDLRFSAYLLFLNGLFVHEERWLSGITLLLGAAVFTAVGHDRPSSTDRDRRESAAGVAQQLRDRTKDGVALWVIGGILGVGLGVAGLSWVIRSLGGEFVSPARGFLVGVAFATGSVVIESSRMRRRQRRRH